MKIPSVFDGEPDAVNEIGVKWWKDTSTTNYAQREDRFGTSLDAVCYAIDEVSGRRTRVLVANGKIIEDDPSLEGMACKIEVRKLLKRDHAKYPSNNKVRKPRVSKRRITNKEAL